MLLMPPGIVAPHIQQLPGPTNLVPSFARRELATANVASNKHHRVLVQQVFDTAGTFTWFAPLSTLSIEALTGVGAAGTPEVSADPTYLITKTVTSGGTTTTTYEGGYGIAPENYCVMTGGSGGGTTTCYTYTQDENSYQPATTGASTSAFDQVFAGGVGGPAVGVVVKSNIHVKPGAPYVIFVPAGGAVNFSYYADT
jgi:hypothetical protein